MRKTWTAIIIFVVVLMTTGLADARKMRPRIVFLDVGQGDAIYIRAPAGQDILIDAGAGRAAVNQLQIEMPRSDHIIELALATHWDKDHMGGFTYVLDDYKIDKFLIHDYSGSSHAAQELKDKLDSLHVKKDVVERGWEIEVPGLILEVLWPPEKPTLTTSNDLSLVIRARTRSGDFLLTGDATQKSERALLNLETPLVASVLKVGHHGSKNSSSQSFLNAVVAEQAVIQVGANNHYGHPSGEVISRLLASNYAINRTDQVGSLTYYLENWHCWFYLLPKTCR